MVSSQAKKANWSKLADHPAVYLILGDVGTGKTHTACSVMDAFHKKRKGLKFFMLAEKNVVANYPKWIKHKSPKSPFIPQNSVVFIDDAHLYFYSREWYKTDKVLDFIARERRQSGNTIIYTTQQGRAMDITLLSMASCVILFRYSKLQYEFERPQLRAMIDRSEEALKAEGYKMGLAYVFSASYEGLIRIKKVGWFTDKMSKAHRKIVENQTPKTSYVKPFTEIIKSIGRLL